MKEVNSCIRVFADVEQIRNCKAKLEKVDESILLLSNAMDMAGNAVRLKIMYLLHQEKKLCVCDISDILNMKIPAISQHLRKMRDRGIITHNKVGQTIYSMLDPNIEDLFEPFFKGIHNNKVLADFEV